MEREHGVMPAIAHGPSTAFGHLLDWLAAGVCSP